MKLNLPCQLMMAVAFMIVTAFNVLNATNPADTLLMRRQWGCATVTPGMYMKASVENEYILPIKKSDLSLPLPSSDAFEQLRKENGNLFIYGNVVYAEAPTGSKHVGMWHFNTAGQFIGVHPRSTGEQGTFVYLDGIYYNYYYYYHPDDYFKTKPLFDRLVIDTETWETVPMPSGNMTEDTHPWALCTDGKDVYGWYGKNAPFKFGKLNVVSNTWTYISDSPQEWYEVAFGKDGLIYCIDQKEGVYKVNPTDGGVVKIGDTGCASTPYSNGLIADMASGHLYRTFMANDGISGLYEIDPQTGIATKLCDFAQREQVIGLYIPGQEGDKAPAPVSEVSVEFPKGALSGTVKFKSPLTLNDNTSASGKLTYTISLNEVQVKTGETSYGSAMSVSLSVDSAAIYCFAVSVSNDKGKSLSKRKVLFVGNDTPLSPQVYINYSDGKFNIKWNTPKGIHAAYLDTLSMRYTVKRYPDEVEVAKEISTNSFEDAVPLPSTVIRYYYTVTASCNGKTSQPGKSNIVQLGSYNLPYLEPFDNTEAFAKFVVEDANQDTETWIFTTAYYTRRNPCVTISSRYGTKADDWLISPPVNLEKGKTYNLSADFVSLKSETQPEARYEVYMGKEATSSAMTMPVSGAFDVPNMGTLEAEKHTWSFTAKESGSYHIGIHCITPSNGGSMCLDNLSVSRALAGVPDSVSDLQVRLDDTNGWKAIIKGKAPLKDVDGNTLQSIDIIKVFRDGRLKKVISDITPGDEFSLEDTKINVGKDCRWDVVCNNSKGDGKWSELHLFLNDNNVVPEAVENLKVKEISETKYEISWTPPAYNRSGEPLDSKKLKYIINLSFNGNIYPDDIYTDYGDTCYIFTTESKQTLLDISVMAANANGRSEKRSLPQFLTGDSYKLPYRESFANGKEWSYITGNWRINNNTSGIESADDDNGYIRAEFSGQYKTENLYTGKIDLGKASHPYFSFYLYNIFTVVNDTVFNDTNELEVFAREEGTEEWVSLLRGKVYDLCGGANATPNAWHFMRVGLDKFKGKRIRLQMTSTSDLYGVTQVDRLVVADAVDRNLGANALRGPAKVRFNKDFILTARVENRGVKQISEYDVAFYRDGAEEPFQVVPGVSLAPEGVAYLSAHDTLGINLATKPHKYKAVVRCENDADPSDNTTSEITVKCEYGPKAKPTSLSGDAADKVVSLVWNAPVVTSGYSGSEGAESFENYDAWAYENVGDWTFLDVDQQGIGSFNLKDPLWGGYHLLDIPNSPLLSTRSFIVIKNGQFGLYRDFSSFIPHSGQQFLASLSPFSGKPVDDWLISPVLDGKAQTVRFFARGYSASRPEAMEMRYSVTGKDTADFVLVKEVASVPGEWTEYSFDIPAGAKYFAVRSKSTQGSMLMLDDFTFNVAPMLVSGYKVYRDGRSVNDNLVSDVSYTDYSCPGGKHPYHVTAIYNDGGESAPSNAVYITNGVHVIPDGVVVEGGLGFIAIKGAEGRKTSVVNTAGIVCYDAVPENDIRISLPAGVYLVRISGVPIKVIVR